MTQRPGPVFCKAAPPPLSLSLGYLADALLFDALHRKDVLAGGRERHSRVDPIAGGAAGGGGGGE